MMRPNDIITEKSDAFENHTIDLSTASFQRPVAKYPILSWLLIIGNILLILLVGTLLWTQNARAIMLSVPRVANSSTSTIPYQGRLADSTGSPLNETTNIVFRLYNASDDGEVLWEEQWADENGIQVRDGLFHVLLGSINPIEQTLISSNSTLYLGITVGTDNEMSPRMQLGSVPFAIQALTVPDGSITAEKLNPELGLARIESGFIARATSHENWTLHEDIGERKYTASILFEESFSNTPEVVVGLARADLNPSANGRIAVSAINVTQNGFDLVFMTWADSQVYSAGATWIAYISP
ncbi:MAG: H-type lectin domain-containing protein [Chloroflexota bacterium]